MTSTTMKWSQHSLSSFFSSSYRFVTMLPYKRFNRNIFPQLLLSMTSSALHILSELGVYWCPAFLPGDEELNSKKALQGKVNENQDKLMSVIVGGKAIELIMFAYYTGVDVPLLFLLRQLNWELGLTGLRV